MTMMGKSSASIRAFGYSWCRRCHAKKDLLDAFYCARCDSGRIAADRLELVTDAAVARVVLVGGLSQWMV
jgi:ribosomal protein L40E